MYNGNPQSAIRNPHSAFTVANPRYDAEAAKLAWERTLEFFKKNLK